MRGERHTHDVYHAHAECVCFEWQGVDVCIATASQTFYTNERKTNGKRTLIQLEPFLFGCFHGRPVRDVREVAVVCVCVCVCVVWCGYGPTTKHQFSSSLVVRSM